ncbi:hypothetical protein [Flavobacterium psychrotolerans]|nr:hypothetical protein [Flavobacterium psychrotolerans]
MSQSSFDFGTTGGYRNPFFQSVFIQGRYVLGLSDMIKDSDITNRVIQLSLEYSFK